MKSLDEELEGIKEQLRTTEPHLPVWSNGPVIQLFAIIDDLRKENERLKFDASNHEWQLSMMENAAKLWEEEAGKLREKYEPMEMIES